MEAAMNRRATIIDWILCLSAMFALLLFSQLAFSAELELGAGKALNNTNAKLPGWAGSAHLSLQRVDIGYTRLGASQLAENAAISTVGYRLPAGKFDFTFSAITGASYSAAVWWDKEHPHQCGVEGCGRRYDNDGRHFSRACHMCGGVIGVEYALSHGFGLRADYYGLRHMTPTFQGVIVELTYQVPL